MPSLLWSLLAIFRCCIAQGCWRDTQCSDITEEAFPGPWQQNIYAPKSRIVFPAGAFVLDNHSLLTNGSGQFVLSSNSSALVLDFGKEVGGVVSLEYSTRGGSGSLGLAFSEAKDYVGLQSDSSNGKFALGSGDFACEDGALYSRFSSEGNHSYTMDEYEMRGGFRYLTLFLMTCEDQAVEISITKVQLELSFQPTWSNLRAYQGYFHSNDRELNKIWYSGAYTLQTNAVPVNTGRKVPTLSSGWANNGTLANGSVTIVDGAKRDRAVWPGDMAIAVPSAFYSIGDIEMVQSALQTMYDHQNADGSLPEAGPPLLQQNSDTYHMWTLIGTYYYVLYTNDTEFLDKNWPRYTRAVDYVLGKILQPLNLLNVTGTRDWARMTQGGNNTEANVILYHTLTTGSELAIWKGLSDSAEVYQDKADKLNASIYEHLWDEEAGSFRDNATSTNLHPQDANSMALLFGLVDKNSSQSERISQRLTQNWTPIGAEAPELPDNISPFISSFEIQAHFAHGFTNRALELIRRSWGWYLNHPNGTGSTVIEGYLTNGSFGYRNYRGYAYDSTYVSHAHGWSSGPTSALTNYIVGLRVTERLGIGWLLAPHFGDLNEAEGGFSTTLGKFSAKWRLNRNNNQYTLSWDAPKGTRGRVELPPLPSGRRGAVRDGNKFRGWIAEGEPFMALVDGGSHEIYVTLA